MEAHIKKLLAHNVCADFNDRASLERCSYSVSRALVAFTLGGNGAENTGVVQYICPCSVLILSYISCIALGGKSLHTYFF